jgi:hypothetical protein
MLKLNIFNNKKLKTPEMLLQANDVVELLEPFLALIKSDKQGSYDVVLKDKFSQIGIDVKQNFLRKKKYYNNIFLTTYLVDNKLAKWLEKDDDLLDPQKASRLYKNSFITKQKTKEKRLLGRKKFLENLSPEEKQKQFQHLPKLIESNRERIKKGMKSFWQDMSETERKEFIASRSKKIVETKRSKAGL